MKLGTVGRLQRLYQEVPAQVPWALAGAPDARGHSDVAPMDEVKKQQGQVL